MPDFADRLVEELDKLVEVGGHGAWGSLDTDAAAKLIREQCAGILTAAALLKRPIQPCPCCTVMMPKGTLHICREPSIENVDSELRAAGLDPDEVGRRGADLVARLRRPHEDGDMGTGTGTVSVAAGKGLINGVPVSWEASEQKLEWPEYGVQREDVELDDGRIRGMISKPELGVDALYEAEREARMGIISRGIVEPFPSRDRAKKARKRKHVQFHSPYEDTEDGS